MGDSTTEALVDAATDQATDSTLDAGPGEGAADVVADSADACPPASDYQTDPENCGSCGHSCLGGACSQGQCQPLVVSASEISVTKWLASDDTGLYWTEQGTSQNGFADGVVRYVALTSTTPVTLASNQHSPEGIATDGTSIFFLTDGTPGDAGGTFQGDGQLLQCPTVGCGAGPTVLASNLNYYLPAPVLTSSTVYFYARVNVTGGGQGILEVPKGGGVLNLILLGAGGPYLTLVGSTFYWAAGGSALTFQSMTASSSTLLYSLSDSVFGMTVDTNAVYWTQQVGTQPSGLFSCLLPTCFGGPSTIYIAQNGAGALAMDAANFYWLDGYNVLTCSRQPPCNPTLVSSTVMSGGATAIVVADRAIYWTGSLGLGMGTIVRLAK